ncbi:MAG: M48 family metallopeptidase [Candidatus Zixiibacteriota bacterium]
MRRRYYLLLFLLLLTITPAVIATDSVSTEIADSAVIGSGDSIVVGAVSVEEPAGTFQYPMNQERKSLLISYSKFVSRWRFFSFFIQVAIFLMVLYLGLSGLFRRWAEKISSKKVPMYFFYFLFLMVFLFLINLPFSYYRGFLIEHQYGFSNQSFGEWFGESLKSEAVGLVFGFVIILILYWLINRFRKWWLLFGLGAIPFAAFVIIIYPVVVAPLFNKFEPIKNQEVATAMRDLAEKAGIHNPDIFEVDASRQSSKVNAYFTGMFGTKRIVLYDTTIKNFTVNELRFIMGHEIGHYLLNHIWYGLFTAVILIFLAGFLADKILPSFIRRNENRFGIRNSGDIASLPVFLLFITVFGFITQPINNGVSRYFEYQSDEYGLKLSGVNGEEAATAFDKLSVFNLSDPEPSALTEFWFYDHPALKKRMENVKELYKRQLAVKCTDKVCDFKHTEF